MKVTERFSDRVENYIKYRPHYPKEIIPFLESEIGLSSSSVIADIGSGTGISSEMFLQHDNPVFSIEPNKEMRLAAEGLLSSYPNFHSIDAPAEATTLNDASIDMIISAQAFHWFDVERSAKEFRRILKENGYCVLIWNERETTSSEFLAAYENLLNTFGTDYQEVNHMNSYSAIEKLFSGKYYNKNFPNKQVFNFEGLKGRLLSSSYTPRKNGAKFLPMIAELENIFTKFQVNNTVEFTYVTQIFYGKL